MMTEKDKARAQAKAEFNTYLAAVLLYWGFRVLGATKAHAWERARLAVAEATIDRVVEKLGIMDPRGVSPGKMQITFEGGPRDREVTAVEICGTVLVEKHGQKFLYRRTKRMRGDSTIFALESTFDPH